MTLEPLRVLLVEDNPAEADLIRSMLADTTLGDLELEHVTRLGDAETRLAEGGVGLVLLDLSLPDARGVANVERVQRALPGVPVIVLTNDADEDAAARAVREGAQDYLLKRDVDAELLGRSMRYAMERQRADDALRESEERYALAVAGANDGLWDWDLVNDTVYYSPRFLAILGYSPGELPATIAAWFDHVVPEDRPALQAAFDAHLRGDSEYFEHEHRLSAKTGAEVWVLSRGLAVRRPDGKPYRFAGSLTDVGDRKRVEAQLLHDAMHDALTGLPNRALLLDRLAQALKRYRRDPENRFAVLFVDLDRFKTVNDSLGHAIGDELLAGIGERLQECIRPGDTLARLGGDEFAVIVEDLEDLSDATHVAERVHEALKTPFWVAEHEVFTSASIGIAFSSDTYERPENMLRDADIAMYRAKSEGHVPYAVFDSAMHQSAIALLRLETALRRAVERNEFVLHYQPIYSLETERLLGFEALLRWRHPELGLMLPDYFIPIAEETGLITPISWWVLREACRQTRIWQEMFPDAGLLSISVNISGHLFTRPGMAEGIVRVLDDTGLPPHSLRLEITESAIMDHRDAALAELAALRTIGVQLHIDDFGTGYSSLSYLQRFAYDTLKIDRSFIRNIESAGDSNSIVQAIVGLGRMLNMNVIAEGVETPGQARCLRALRCPEAQGNWFSRPIDGAGAETLLLEARR
jgi:diguanylate cyclase (GGDEF)-like protein/PAS domain S-box-containing protein